MRFEVEFGGRPRSVAIERAGRAGRYRVVIDGKAQELEAARAGAYGLLLGGTTFRERVSAGTADKSQVRGTLASPATDGSHASPSVEAVAAREVFVTPAGRAGEVLVTLDGRTATVTVNGRRTGHSGDPGAHTHGDQPVVAPMPGRVVRVLVAPGEQVSARQGVVVVEAMKMENELRAPKGGRVKDVSVSPGTSVEAGRVLVVIE